MLHATTACLNKQLSRSVCHFNCLDFLAYLSTTGNVPDKSSSLQHNVGLNKSAEAPPLLLRRQKPKKLSW